MRICYAGGGTLGHVLPALSVHAVLSKEPDYACLFIGSGKKGEREAVIASGIPFVAIHAGKLRRYVSLRNIADAFLLLAGFFQSLVILARWKPNVLFSKGGYVSVPPVYAAKLLHIPVVTHESDSTPGLATRLDGKVANRICVAFPEAGKGLPQEKVVVTGNPLRPQMLVPPQYDAKRRLGSAKPLVLVLGGSQGAHQINTLVWDHLDELTRIAFVFHQCGEHDYHQVIHKDYSCTAFIGEGLNELLSAADLVISRSGAGAISEICHFGKASLLLPLPSSQSRGDQMENALRLEKHGAAVILRDEKDFIGFVDSLLEGNEKRSKLGKEAKSLDVSDAAERIARILKEEAR